ncbi:Probable DNA double-strand break repair Rad50 ATPase [Dermatophilus congolensis]|uniref:Probable DNA double-strand break repair Rad50 ATPase n=1 Tax=Dermatophilus congolensis TaxID=1863 RepID=A0A239VEZ3_9MICO|nr:AAA family ATPase [Dermatophilus congolensis]SNV20154.1 Probable DNA double-strand break repair Rad50 ATPase [Dermatophilus congolensis]
MKFHALTVRNFKGITETTVEFPDTGVIIIEGPNEAGKSSLIEAIDLLFRYKDSSSHKAITEAHPIGEDESPYVELEASIGPYRFSYAKRWAKRGANGARGRGGKTTLHITTPRTENHSGVAAHERATEILEEYVDTPLWDALRLLQGSELAPICLEGSTQLRAALDAASGAGTDAGGDGDTILTAVESEYTRYFTPSTGRPKGEYEKALAHVAAAQEQRDAAQRAVEEVDRDVKRHANISASIVDLRVKVQETENQARQWATRREQADTAREREAAAKHALTEALRVQEDSQSQAARREVLIDDVAGRVQQVQEAEKDFAAAAQQRTQMATRAEQVGEEITQAESHSRVCRRAVAAARQRRRQGALEQEKQRLSERVARVDDVAARLGRARNELEELRVDAQLREKLEAAEREVEVARIAQRAASARVTGRALAGSAAVEVDGAAVELGEDESEWVLCEPIEVVVPGVAAFRWVPEAGAAEHIDQVRRAEREVERLLVEECGVDSMQEAHRQASRRVVVEAEIERGEAERSALLAGDEISWMRDRLEEVEGALASMLLRTDGAEDKSDAADDGSEVALSALVEAEESAADEVERLRVRGEEAAVAAAEAREAATAAEANLVAGRRELQVRQSELEAARAQLSDEDVNERVVRAVAAVQEAQVEHEQARQAAQEAATGEEQLVAVERRVEGARSRLADAERELVRIEAVLEQAGGQGRAEQLDEAASQLEVAEHDAQVVTRRAEAARMLREVLREHSAQAKAAYVAPFRAEVERLGRLVYGPSFHVVVAEDLQVQERVLHGVNVPFESLSSGAKEQLSILVRLAVAQLVEPGEGVPVVIDDALGYSDPQRIVATTAAFESIGERAQVVMLTCTPGRYDGVRGAEVVVVGQDRYSVV